MGGVGKSTLAAYFYHSLDFEVKFWADVSLKPNFIVFAEKIIRALGGKVTLPIDITELINNLLRLLSQRRCLLVVDNLETLLDKERNWQDENYQQFFSRWLKQGTNSTLFLTTQDKPQLFQQGLQFWHSLGGMKIEEGIALLNKLQIQGTESEFRKFVEYVDGHPLTISLVAGYLINYCGGQLNQVAESGSEQFDLAYQEAIGNHRDQQNARLYLIIEQHLKRLTKEQYDFLVDLSVYRLSFNRKAANYILVKKTKKSNLWIKLSFLKQWFKLQDKEKKIKIAEILQELCNRSLLMKTANDKYQIQSVVREYLDQRNIDLVTAHMQALCYYSQYLKEGDSWRVLEDIGELREIMYHCCKLLQYNSINYMRNYLLHIVVYCNEYLKLVHDFSVLLELSEQLISGRQPNLQAEDLHGEAITWFNLGDSRKNRQQKSEAKAAYKNARKLCQAMRLNKKVEDCDQAIQSLEEEYDK